MNKSTSLWDLLTGDFITIPVIQRDYAQGRKNMGHIRKNFLSEIKKHLDASELLTLDFIYGNNENGKFCPIDGQQRLTTLWLLHWYIALKSGNLNDETKAKLMKFSYEIRDSSRDFCKALCDINPDAAEEESLEKYIKNQTWFYTEWLQDPTVNAILRTISGENGSADDNIESIFADNFSDYWEKLTVSGIISFELLEIGTENLPISDDLYIKMNARGKALTNFENLKADIIEKLENTDGADTDYYAKKLDGDWTDFFWREAKENFERINVSFDGRIDEIYYSFFNRFVLNKIIRCGNVEKSIAAANFASDKRKEDAQDSQKSILKAFDKLYGKGGDDTDILYENFEIYDSFITTELLDKFNTVLNVYSKNKQLINEELNVFTNEDEDAKKNYSFIPQYNNDANNIYLNSTNQKERAYFYAICCFIEKCTFSNNNFIFDTDKEIKFKRWMRVCRNLIENADIRSIPVMITCISKIDELCDKVSDSKYGNDIYSYLSDCTESNKNDSKLEIQLDEEIQKAKAITDINAQISEEEITDAEKLAFFKGAIRFLFRDSEDKVDWGNFKIKAEKAEELFNPPKGIKNTVKYETVKLFLEQFDSFNWYVYLSPIGYSRKKEEHCWKTYILCDSDKKFSKQVENMLLGKSALHHNEIYEAFLNSIILKDICKESESYKYHYQDVLGEFAIHKAYGPRNEHYIFVTKNRLKKNKILSEFAKISADNQLEVVNYKGKAWTFIRGKDIYFEFENEEFDFKIKWNENEKTYADYICLVDDENRGIFWSDENKDEIILKLKNI